MMDILLEENNFLIVDKPAGIPVLTDGWAKEAPYLVKQLEEVYGRIWVVHRLDKTTSGVMIFARNAETHRSLNTQFELHQTQKVYHAILEGEPQWKEKVASFPLRTNVGHKHRTIVDEKGGKPSETRFRVLRRSISAALVEARPTTGRTHQIRVHALTLGHPLLADYLYEAEETEIIQRPALHAHSLTFTHPLSQELLTYTAPRPNDFVEALQQLGL